MKPIIMLCMLIFSMYSAHARAKIPVGKVEQLRVVHALPDTEDYQVSGSGEFLDLATLHEEFNIAWIIPVWVTKEPRLVLGSAHSDMYYELTEEQLQAIIQSNNLKPEQLLRLPLYTRFGGKVVLAVLFGFMIYGLFSGGKDEQEDVPPVSTRGSAADPVTQGHIVAATNAHVASAGEESSHTDPNAPPTDADHSAPSTNEPSQHKGIPGRDS